MSEKSPESIWERALKARVGICVSTNDKVLLRQQLYRFRAQSKDDRLDAFAIIFNKAAEDELWIVRKDAK